MALILGAVVLILGRPFVGHQLSSAETTSDSSESRVVFQSYVGHQLSSVQTTSDSSESRDVFQSYHEGPDVTLFGTGRLIMVRHSVMGEKKMTEGKIPLSSLRSLLARVERQFRNRIDESQCDDCGPTVSLFWVTEHGPGEVRGGSPHSALDRELADFTAQAIRDVTDVRPYSPDRVTLEAVPVSRAGTVTVPTWPQGLPTPAEANLDQSHTVARLEGDAARIWFARIDGTTYYEWNGTIYGVWIDPEIPSIATP